MLDLAIKAYTECLLHVVYAHERSEQGNQSEIAAAESAIDQIALDIQSVWPRSEDSDERRSARVSVVPCGSEWINIHGGNPDLVGVYVRQFPDNKVDQLLYEGRHPASVVFVFKNNRAHQLSFTPSGQVRDGFWWDIPEGSRIFDDMSTVLKQGTICRSDDTFDFRTAE